MKILIDIYTDVQFVANIVSSKIPHFNIVRKQQSMIFFLVGNHVKLYSLS